MLTFTLKMGLKGWRRSTNLLLLSAFFGLLLEHGDHFVIQSHVFLVYDASNHGFHVIQAINVDDLKKNVGGPELSSLDLRLGSLQSLGDKIF